MKRTNQKAANFLGGAIGMGMVLVMVGCATVSEQRLGQPVTQKARFQVKLEGKGQLVVTQRLAANARCAQMKTALTVSATGESGTPPVNMVASCDFKKNYLSYVSKDMLRPGTYSVSVRKGEGALKLLDKPVISAKFEDPDFNSGADFMADGAKDLPSGQVSKGFISTASGNATDWIRISGKGGAVALTFVDGTDDKNLQAQVFDLSRGARHPKLVGTLGHKQTKSFALKTGKLYVRIKGEPFAGDGNYSLVRGDSASPAVATSSGAGSKISVIDCYQVGEGESVVLLEAGEGLKISDEVVVFGRPGAGDLVQLGECEVTTVQGGQASCRMGSNVESKYTEFKAVAKPRG